MCVRMFQGCFKNFSSEFYVLKSFKGISRKLVGVFKGVSVVSGVLEKIQREFQRSFNGVSSVFHCSSVSRKIEGCSQSRSRVIQGTFKGISRVFQ